MLRFFTVLPGKAGPRPTLPPGGRILEVVRRTLVLQSVAAMPPSTVSCAHPGSGAALYRTGLHP